MNDKFVEGNWEEMTNRLVGMLGAVCGISSSQVLNDKLYLEQFAQTQAEKTIQQFYSELTFGAKTEEVFARYGKRAETLKEELLTQLKQTETKTLKEVKQVLSKAFDSASALSDTANSLREVMEK